MRFSEAIRIGARRRPQTKFRLFADGRSCAMGAAIEALTGLTDINIDLSRLRAAYPWAWKIDTYACPLDCTIQYSISEIIMYLNDCHEWSREALLSFIPMPNGGSSGDVNMPTTLGDGAQEVEIPCEEGVPAGTM